MTYTDYRQTLDILYDAINRLIAEDEHGDVQPYYILRNAIWHIQHQVPESYSQFTPSGAN